jgi:hypothetical protein
VEEQEEVVGGVGVVLVVGEEEEEVEEEEEEEEVEVEVVGLQCSRERWRPWAAAQCAWRGQRGRAAVMEKPQ